MTQAVAEGAPRTRSAPVFIQRYGVYFALLLLLVFNVAFTPNFFTADNFRTQLVQVVPGLIVALGMALAIGT
ncbi:hypothetical protein [Leifsonia xyli]|uniref:hypothetical protein n=1 Tax=Leifsonia xyli TaxID=1575 RepID=UPI0002E6BB47|nr:hypothetical protein [Leifsonia xyli]